MLHRHGRVLGGACGAATAVAYSTDGYGGQVGGVSVVHFMHSGVILVDRSGVARKGAGYVEGEAVAGGGGYNVNEHVHSFERDGGGGGRNDGDGDNGGFSRYAKRGRGGQCSGRRRKRKRQRWLWCGDDTGSAGGGEGGRNVNDTPRWTVSILHAVQGI